MGSRDAIPSAYSTLCCKRIRLCPKTKGTSPETLSQTLNLTDLSALWSRYVGRHKCCRRKLGIHTTRVPRPVDTVVIFGIRVYGPCPRPVDTGVIWTPVSTRTRPVDTGSVYRALVRPSQVYHTERPPSFKPRWPWHISSRRSCATAETGSVQHTTRAHGS